MDGDRPVVDGRDIFERQIQAIVRDAFIFGYACLDVNQFRREYTQGSRKECQKQVHEAFISYFDGPASDVGAQDETT